MTSRNSSLILLIRLREWKDSGRILILKAIRYGSFNIKNMKEKDKFFT
jgi:hypothetical protein